MNEQELTQTLERRADTVHVGPPPFAEIHGAAAARQRTRRGFIAVLASVSAVVLVTVGVAVVGNHDERSIDPVSPDTRAETPPEGHHWVGIGHVAMAVPNDWQTAQNACVTPSVDTVYVDSAPYPVECPDATRPDGVESVQLVPWLTAARGVDVNVAGRPALREDSMRQRVRTTVISFPGERAIFEIQSSSADAEAEVERLVDSIRVLKVGIAVPGFQVSNLVTDDSVNRYLEELRASGLEAQVVHASNGEQDTPRIRYTDPVPGTVLTPGSTVVVTVRP